MLVTEAFKQFCKERHAEDKGKNYNLLQEVYANTEFFDLSLYDFSKERKQATMSEVITEGDNSLVCFEIDKEINLPFQNNFIKCEQEGSFIFIREYEPNVLTGSLYCISNLLSLNQTFTIVLKETTLTICIETHSILQFFEHENKGTIDNIIRNLFIGIFACLDTLNNLSKKEVTTDNYSSSSTHADYYRRKGEPTIKVPSRPIYYVLGDKNENVSHKYSQIKSRGKFPHFIE